MRERKSTLTRRVTAADANRPTAASRLTNSRSLAQTVTATARHAGPDATPSPAEAHERRTEGRRRGRWDAAGPWRLRASASRPAVFAGANAGARCWCSCCSSSLLVVSVAADADAPTSCSHEGAPTSRLTVTASGSAQEGIALGEIKRRGSEIVVGEYLEPPTRCSGGVPTVLNTDMIRVLVRGDASVDLRLDGGPFEPGATPEAAGAPELEVEFSGGLLGFVVGTRRADEFHWGPGGAHAGLNLNPDSAGDQDVDVTARGAITSLMARGGAGNDTIIPGPGAVAADGVFSVGGQGNDRLIAPRRSDAILHGGPGEDAISGGRALDSLVGGAGNDHVAGGGGDDEINGGRGNNLLLGGRGRDSIRSRDGMRDRVSCGAGRYRTNADRRDRLRGCELKRRLRGEGRPARPLWIVAARLTPVGKQRGSTGRGAPDHCSGRAGRRRKRSGSASRCSLR
jgi:RTX calcium-binding nonapeptide repeat (4 copies)